ncbi:MAG: type II toxin-antitoxin system VapB family antitoxin [Bacteroidota bacterium]
MRTNIVIDDELMKEAIQVSGLRTKKEVVEKALHLLVDFSGQRKIRKYRGKLDWQGDLEASRKS